MTDLHSKCIHGNSLVLTGNYEDRYQVVASHSDHGFCCVGEKSKTEQGAIELFRNMHEKKNIVWTEGGKAIEALQNFATKHDQEKNPLELLPFEALEEVGKVLQFGAKKYDAHNWRKGFIWSRLIGAAIRHVFSFARGEDKDPETGYSHLAHAACCILFLLSFQITNNGTDDRVKV